MNNKEFHVVIVEEGKPAVLYSFDTMSQLRTKIAMLFVDSSGNRQQVFVFKGARWYVTANKYLIAPDGQNFPLFDMPPIGVPDLDGFIAGAPEVKWPDVDDDYQKATASKSKDNAFEDE